MTLGAYVISSLLLSWIGWGVYLLMRWVHPRPLARRRMVWLVLASSLLIPLTAPFAEYAGTYDHPAQAQAEFQTSSAVIPPAGQSLHEFCHCTQPETSDVILYQASRFYDVLLANAGWIGLVLLICTLFFTLRYLLGLRQLMRLVRRQPASPLDLAGQRVWCIRGQGDLAAGALWLGRSYIFWHPSLDQLPREEQQAILLHELSHLRQRNTLEKLFLSLLQGIWFMNPIWYFFSRELETLSEYVADEFAAGQLQSRKRYAGLLLRVKSGQALAMAHLFKGGQLRKRIERILQGPETTRMPLWPAFFLGLVLLLSSELAAQKIIRSGLLDMEIYEYISEAHQRTGQEEFCKKCTLEAVDCPNMDW